MRFHARSDGSTDDRVFEVQQPGVESERIVGKLDDEIGCNIWLYMRVDMLIELCK